MSNLPWSKTKPVTPGWYWVRALDGAEKCVEVTRKSSGACFVNGFTPLGVATYTAWAGPISRPKEPSAQQLAEVRYKLEGEYLHGHFFGQYEWDFCSRDEMLRRARVRLHGDTDYFSKPIEADAKRVWLFTSRKRNGRWKTEPREEFTKENLPASPEVAP